MTLAIGVAYFPEDGGGEILVASDTRLSISGRPPNDAGVKTLEVGGNSVMAVAGTALPALIAAELARPIIDNHNRREKRRIGFYDTWTFAGFHAAVSA